MSEVPSSGVAGVLLAAGSGTRMGAPKAELVVGGRRLLDRAAAALLDGGCSPVVAVVRADTAPLAESAQTHAAETPSRPRCTSIVNPDPDRGMRSSLEIGLAGVPEARAIAVVLVDVPGLTAPAVASVLAGWRPGRIAVGVVAARRSHPTVMSARMWQEAVAVAEPDEGARRYLRAHADLVDEVEIDIDPRDLDTPEDLAAWTE